MFTCTQYHKTFQLFLALSAAFITIMALTPDRKVPSGQNKKVAVQEVRAVPQAPKHISVSSFGAQKPKSPGTFDKKKKKKQQSMESLSSGSAKSEVASQAIELTGVSVHADNSTLSTGAKALCYQSCPVLEGTQTISVQGAIPAWLHGTFFLNGPGIFEINGNTFKRWFDGFAMIHAFDIHAGHVSYANSAVQSGYYTNARKTGQLPSSTQEKKSSLFSTFSNLVSERPPYDNTNVNIQVIDKTVIACTETDHCFAIDRHTGHTHQKYAFKDTLKGHVCTPHMLTDPQTGHQYNVMTAYGKTSEYVVYEINNNSRTRTALCTIVREAPSYMHSYALTKNYIILIEVPFQVRGMDLAFSSKPYLQNFNWQPEQGTIFTLIDRTSKKVAHTITMPALFMFHAINSYESDSMVIIDLVSYPDTSVINNMSLDHLRTTLISKPGNAQRVTLDLKKGTGTHAPLTKQRLENPRIKNSTVPQNTAIFTQ